MPAAAIAETRADRDALASIWTAILAPWRRAADLSELLGVHRSLLSHYASGSRTPGWPTTRAAARLTARRHPEAAPALMQAIGRELLDVDGTWVPDVDAADLSGIESEVGDVMVATGRLLALVRAGASRQDIDAAAADVCRQAHEAASAARGA